MIARKMTDQRAFTKQLFLETAFDPFLLQEAVFVTDCTVTLDGRVVADQLSEEERTALPDPVFHTWGRLRPLAFQIIKGARLPKSFHIVLGLSRPQIEKLIADHDIPVPADQVGGLYLNLRYEDNQLLLVTGVSLRTFLPDKSLESDWDRSVGRFLAHHGLEFEEL